MQSGTAGVAPATVEASRAEEQFLQDHAESLQSQLEAVKKRITEIQASAVEN
jgi:prefoldin subunit 5